MLLFKLSKRDSSLAFALPAIFLSRIVEASRDCPPSELGLTRFFIRESWPALWLPLTAIFFG